MSTQQRRPEVDFETASTSSLAADSRIQPLWPSGRVRIALDTSMVTLFGGLTSSGSGRLYLDDLPAGAHVTLDVTDLPYPVAEATHRIACALRRGVLVEIEASTLDYLHGWQMAVADWFRRRS